MPVSRKAPPQADLALSDSDKTKATSMWCQRRARDPCLRAAVHLLAEQQAKGSEFGGKSESEESRSEVLEGPYCSLALRLAYAMPGTEEGYGAARLSQRGLRAC
eukprot:22774-Rhodomonas_salina.2